MTSFDFAKKLHKNTCAVVMKTDVTSFKRNSINQLKQQKQNFCWPHSIKAKTAIIAV